MPNSRSEQNSQALELHQTRKRHNSSWTQLSMDPERREPKMPRTHQACRTPMARKPKLAQQPCHSTPGELNPHTHRTPPACHPWPRRGQAKDAQSTTPPPSTNPPACLRRCVPSPARQRGGPQRLAHDSLAALVSRRPKPRGVPGRPARIEAQPRIAPPSLDEHPTRHEAMARPTELGTLATELAALQRCQPHPRNPPRNGIDLHPEPRHRVAVNHVDRGHAKPHARTLPHEQRLIDQGQPDTAQTEIATLAHPAVTAIHLPLPLVAHNATDTTGIAAPPTDLPRKTRALGLAPKATLPNQPHTLHHRHTATRPEHAQPMHEAHHQEHHRHHSPQHLQHAVLGPTLANAHSAQPSPQHPTHADAQPTNEAPVQYHRLIQQHSCELDNSACIAKSCGKPGSLKPRAATNKTTRTRRPSSHQTPSPSPRPTRPPPRSASPSPQPFHSRPIDAHKTTLRPHDSPPHVPPCSSHAQEGLEASNPGTPTQPASPSRPPSPASPTHTGPLQDGGRVPRHQPIGISPRHSVGPTNR